MRRKGGRTMEGYKVYLTKSYEVAALIEKAHTVGVDYVTEIKISRSASAEVPAVYYDYGFCCVVKYKGIEEPSHKIIFA
ncbi:MAG: hypothetical protein ACLRVB_14330 [Blautia sp.]